MGNSYINVQVENIKHIYELLQSGRKRNLNRFCYWNWTLESALPKASRENNSSSSGQSIISGLP
jgi:hypothetical protein